MVPVKHKTFIKNAAIMTITALILRTIGIFFRIYMSNKIGAEGMGLYQLIFSIYVLGSTFATAGISTAVTRMITDELVCGTKKSVLHILRRAMLISVLIGTASMLLIYFLADPISQYWIKDMRAAPALKILCPSLPCMGISSCLRGYFMARRKVSCSSNAQMVEQLVRIGIVAALVLALVGGGLAVYYSNLFTIENVSVTGVEHLTATDMSELASVPAGTTLLRVDAAGIRERLLKDAWVDDVSVNRVFPNTLELAVTERTITAVVDVPTENAESVQPWAIASDGMWLMPIPDQNSEAGKRTSPKVYEDAAKVLHITDVPYGTRPEVGAYCSDANVNNALAIVDGMTTELAGQVKKVAATETESTTLTLESGVEIVFGTAENIRDKERVCLEIMKEHPDGLAYINVRVVDRPTWRAL